MQTSLMSKCTSTDIRCLRVHGAIQNFGDMITHCCQAIKTTFWQTLITQLQLQVRDNGCEVGIASALTQTIQRSLHVTSTAQHSSHRVGDGTTGVIVAVNADRDIVAHMALHLSNDLLHFMRKASTIGIAQHQVACSLHHCCFKGA